jgi:hypothetical protein
MFVTALLAASLAAPVPKEKPVLYLPTAVGTKLVYETTRDEKVICEVTEVVASAEAKGDGIVVTVEGEDSPGGGWTQVFVVTAKGVSFRLDADAEPEPVFKVGLKAGDTWKVEHAGPRKGLGTSTFTAGKEEEVEVPAGKFKAIPVTRELPLDGRAGSKTTTWYAPGVGVVKKEADSRGGGGVTVLKSFTPGKGVKR